MSDEQDEREGTSERNLPPCGVYRTTAPLPGREEEVPAGRLVYFHNHSQQGPPVVLLPATNADNTWTFHERGYLVRDEGWPATLKPLPREGLYVLRTHMHGGSSVMPERSLVQLGYNRNGEPILFQGRREGNRIEFPTRGLRFREDSIFRELDPAGFVLLEEAPEEPERILH